MGMLLYSCVYAKLGGRIKESGGQTPWMKSLTSSTPHRGRVKDRAQWNGGREKRFGHILPPTDKTG